MLAIASPAFAETRDHVTVAAPWEVISADPSVSGFVYLRMEVTETLVGADDAGRLIAGLATAWTVSDDGLRWRFVLREGVTFHDGTPLTAEAAAASLRRALPRPGPFGGAPVTAIEAADGAVEIALETPFAALPALLAHASTAVLAPASFDAAGEALAVIGTGPFRVAAFEPPLSLDVARFDGWWGDAPAIATARYMAAKRAETRALLAESGDADMVFTLDPAGLARLAEVEDVAVLATPIPRTVTLKLNAGHPAMAEPEARRALSLAIDRAGIAAAIFRNPDVAAGQLFPPALSGWHDPDLPPLAHDPAQAAALLADLGWTPGEDGVLTRDGARFAVTLRTFPNRPEQPLIAAALQDQWRAIGVDLTVSIGNYSEIPAGHQDGTLDMGLFARNFGLTPDPIGVLLADFKEGGGDWGAMNWDAPQTAQALAKIAATADADVRAPLVAAVAATLQRDLPVMPIAWYQQTVAHPTALQGVTVDPFERSYGLSEVSWAR